MIILTAPESNNNPNAARSPSISHASERYFKENSAFLVPDSPLLSFIVLCSGSVKISVVTAPFAAGFLAALWCSN
jgi:hypothetical protein